MDFHSSFDRKIMTHFYNYYMPGLQRQSFAMVSDEDEEAAAMAPSKKAKKDCKRRDISVDIRAMENGTVRRVSCSS